MAKPEPGRDPEMAERTRMLNLVFALSSIALLVALSLMIWADYDREWKPYQKEFNKLEVSYTRQQAEAALGKVDANRRAELEAELKKGEQEVASRRDEVRKAQAEYDKLDGEWYGIDQNFRFTKAKIDVARFNYEEAAYHGEGGAEGKKKKLDDLEAQWQQWRLKLEDVIARRDAAQARL